MKKLLLGLIAAGTLAAGSAVPAQAQRIGGEISVTFGDRHYRPEYRERRHYGQFRRYVRPFHPRRGCRSWEVVVRHNGRLYCMNRRHAYRYYRRHY